MRVDLFVFIRIHVRLQIPFPVFLSLWVRRRSTPHWSKERLSNQIPGMCQILKVLSQYVLINFLFFLVSLKIDSFLVQYIPIIVPTSSALPSSSLPLLPFGFNPFLSFIRHKRLLINSNKIKYITKNRRTEVR